MGPKVRIITREKRGTLSPDWIEGGVPLHEIPALIIDLTIILVIAAGTALL